MNFAHWPHVVCINMGFCLQVAIRLTTTKFPLTGEMSQHLLCVPMGVALQFPCTVCSLAHTQACVSVCHREFTRKEEWKEKQ